MTLKETRLQLQSGKCSAKLPAQQNPVQGFYVTPHQTLLQQLFMDINRQMTFIYSIYLT